MKKRVFNVLNFLALNVLFFALYLNFIHNDANTMPVAAAAGIVAVKLPSQPAKATLSLVHAHKKEPIGAN